MTLITRAEWLAAPPRSKGNAIADRPKGTAVHWHGPSMGAFEHSRCAAKVSAIQAFHLHQRGWADIAYSYLACPHGQVYEGRGLDVGSAANGSTEANRDYYAVCALVGEGDPHPPAMLDAIRDAVALCQTRAGKAIVGHRDLFATACPGDVLYGHVRAGTLQPVTKPQPLPPEDDMPTLPEIATAVWSASFGRGDTRRTAAQLLAEARRDSAAALAAVRAIAKETPNVDEAAVERLITEAAQRVSIDVTVTPSPKE